MDINQYQEYPYANIELVDPEYFEGTYMLLNT